MICATRLNSLLVVRLTVMPIHSSRISRLVTTVLAAPNSRSGLANQSFIGSSHGSCCLRFSVSSCAILAISSSKYNFSPLKYLSHASANNCSRAAFKPSILTFLHVTGQKRLLPVTSFRYPLPSSGLIVPIKILCLG